MAEHPNEIQECDNSIADVPSTSGNATSSRNQLPIIPKRRTLVDQVGSLFECPVCFEFVTPPIMQCQLGHIVCATCRPKLISCPNCRGPLENIRNLFMEQLVENMPFPCKHKHAGCAEFFVLQERMRHEQVCEFRPCRCPCPGTTCRFQGQLENIMDHLKRAHQTITTLDGADIVFLATDIHLPGAVDWVMMQRCYGYNFLLILGKQDKPRGYTQFFASAQIIGTRKQAQQFTYRLELNGNHRRLAWEATPRCSHDGIAAAIRESNCLNFNTSTAQLFIDNNGNLGINVSISVVG